MTREPASSEKSSWVNMERYYPCPVCGYDEISFGPSVSSGGRFQIDAVYCEMCGTVFEVAHWSEKGGVRFARLEVRDG
jgi:transcription elongation factor Elf1